MTIGNGVLIDTRTLPRGRNGLILGKHFVAEYKIITRGEPGKHYGYRVVMEADPGGGAFHLFHVDYFTPEGARPIGRMISFPSYHDCVTMRGGA